MYHNWRISLCIQLFRESPVGIPLSCCYIKITAAERLTSFVGVVKAGGKDGQRKRWLISLMKTLRSLAKLLRLPSRLPSVLLTVSLSLSSFSSYNPANVSLCPPNNTVPLKHPCARDFRTRIPNQSMVYILF